MSRLTLVLASVLVVFSSVTSADFNPNNYNVNCDMYNYWVFVPIDRHLVESWLPSNLQFGSHPFTTLSSSVWPVLLEFNNPENCFVKIVPFYKQSMLEWKLEVPYLTQSGLLGPLMYKPVTYENNLINTVATYLQYGLNAVFPNQMTNNNVTNPATYTITVSSNVGLSAQFYQISGQEQYVPITSTNYSQPYISLNDATEWIGTPLFQKEQCAKIYYQWGQTLVRPVTAQIHMDAGFLPKSQQALDFNSTGVIQAIQIQSVEHITSLAPCTPAASSNSVNVDAVNAPDALNNNNNNSVNLSTGTVIAITAVTSVVATLILVGIITVIQRRRINKHHQIVTHITQHAEPTQRV